MPAPRRQHCKASHSDGDRTENGLEEAEPEDRDLHQPAERSYVVVLLSTEELLILSVPPSLTSP